MGQLGMRILKTSRAPVFKIEGNFDKQNGQVLNKIYIENVWYFAKNKNTDIFKHTKEEH